MSSGAKTAFTSGDKAMAKIVSATKGKGGVVAELSQEFLQSLSQATTDDMVGGAPRSKYAEIAAAPDFPTAVGWRIIIIPIKPMEKTAGGLYLTSETKFANEVLADMGYVASVGPDAYKDPRFLKSEPWCKVGDWVNYGRLNGKDIIFRGAAGEEHRLHVCNDRDVLMALPNPNSMKVFT